MDTFSSSVIYFSAGVAGWETITGTTLAPASVRRLSSIIYVLLSVFLAVVESGRGKGGESYATVQGLGNFVFFLFGIASLCQHPVDSARF